MVLAALFPLLFPDYTSRAKALYLDNVDVTLVPGTGGNRAGVPIDTVRVTEAGPANVSSMEFAIDDPGLTVSVSVGMTIRFQDNTRDVPLFLGYVQRYSVRPAFGEQGRVITVTGVGVEVLLDWAVLSADLTIPNPLVSVFDDFTAATIQKIVAASTGFGDVRTFATAFGAASTQEQPISANMSGGASSLFGTLTIPAGTSVRDAIGLVWANLAWISIPGAVALPAITIDFYFGLRVWETASKPADYTNLTIDDTPAGTIPAEGLDYDVDAAGVVRGVWVIGTGVTAYTSDGTNLPGPINVISDPTITGVAWAQRVGAIYMASFASGLRGSFRLEDRTPVGTIHPGSRAVITDARVGLAAQTTVIGQIEKGFHATRDDWTVSFGGPPPSGAASLRRLTRDTLS